MNEAEKDLHQLIYMLAKGEEKRYIAKKLDIHIGSLSRRIYKLRNNMEEEEFIDRLKKIVKWKEKELLMKNLKYQARTPTS